jgi:hypothetical protein
MARTIAELKALGLTKNQILDRLNGASNQRDVSKAQLKQIGFDTSRSSQILKNQSAGRATWNANDNSKSALEAALAKSKPGGGGGAGGGTGGAPQAPAYDPMEEYLRQQQERQQASAFSLMSGLLDQYGLNELASDLRRMIEQGITDEASITLTLQGTDAWKQRFAGNEMLRSKGLRVLTPKEYIDTEIAIAAAMQQYGLPEDFYNQKSDFAQWIGNNVSAAELNERLQSWSDLAHRQDPAVTAQLQAMGMTHGDLMAFMMDPDRANPLIQKKYKSTLIGASARRAGLTTSIEYADKLAGMGITEEQAQAGYAAISEGLPTLDKLGDIYGQDYNQTDFEAEVFEGNGEATKKRKRLASQERAAFSGSSGVAAGSLRESTAGLF